MAILRACPQGAFNVRAFALTRYFSLASLLLVMLAGGILGFLVRQQEVTQMEQAAQDRNADLAQIFRTVLSDDINTLLQHTGKPPAGPVSGDAPTQAIHNKFVAFSRDSSIRKLKLYNLHGITIFSTDAAQMGEDKSANAGFLAALSGQVASELTHRDQFSATEGSIFNVDLVSSYVPIADGERVVAVFEVYQDVTSLIHRIDKSQWQVAGIVFLVLSMLYLLLLLVVRHAQKLLNAKETQLETANRELDQRVAERTVKLQQSEARFRSLTQMSSDFYWETDSEHRFSKRTLSQRETADPTFRVETFLGQRRWEVPYSSPDQAGWAAHRALLDAHQPFRDFEISRPGGNGALTCITVSGDPLFGKTGVFEGYRGVGTDITARKKVEAEMRIAAAAFESQEAMMVTDSHNVILRVNQAFTGITGYTAEEAIGQTPRLLASGRHDAEFYRSMWEAILRTGGWKGEIWDRRKNGDVYPTWLTITAVKDAQVITTNYIGTHYDITERKNVEEKIRELAFYDSLTRLPNRTLLRDRLKQAMAVSSRGASFGALLFIDLDHFKSLNDTLGHDKGDMLLQQVAERLTAGVREGDTVARLGGDEFVIVLKDLSDNFQDVVTFTKVIGEKILKALNQTYLLGEAEHRNTASIGATVFSGHETTVDDLLKQADMAMYQSKDTGRNSLCFFDPALQRMLLERAAMEAGLRIALQEGQLILHYQPQVARDDQTTGAEALVRWQHPLRGMVSPAEFIPLAEENGLILPLGLWVLETACVQLAKWAANPEFAHLTIAVNVSVRQFRQSDFVEQVLATLAWTRADPQRLKLELTESLLVDNMEDVIQKMQALQARGVSFSLDDFGTGYSSLAYLSQLPLDQLKIDRSFVKDIESSDNAVAICAVTIGLAHSLKLKVVSEGVETEAQRYFLSTVHRCDFIQGYLYSRPLPVDDFEAFVRASQHAVKKPRS
jgi:diguanylate cyclase (GGDEF)-like protein/PAS domain S-box-containing protein